MKALILAAGLGSRLAPITDNCPKSLVRVNGKPILEKQIENLRENGIYDITVIAGYKANILKTYIAAQFGAAIKIIENTEYAATNNMYSAYLAREQFYGHPFLMMNADVFFDSSVIAALLGNDTPSAIVTEYGVYLEESMKVSAQNGILSGIAKTLPKSEAFGTSIDVYKFSTEAGKAFFDKCAEFIEIEKNLSLWSEVAINAILADTIFKPCPLVGRWFEIDTLEDLAAAEKIFA